MNNKKGYLEREWEPIDEKCETDKGILLRNQNRTINGESDIWDTDTREGIQDYSDIKNKKWNALENTTDILLSFRLLADWLVDRSSGRVRLLKDKNIDQRADMWKYKDLNKLLVMFHPDSATRRLTYKMSENIILCTNKVLTWFFSILNNKNGYLQQGWEPVDEKRENDKGMMLQNENRTINEESDLWDTNTREGILNYSDIKNKKWNDWNEKFIIFRKESLLKFETDMNNALDIVIPQHADIFLDDKMIDFSVTTNEINTIIQNDGKDIPCVKEFFNFK